MASLTDLLSKAALNCGKTDLDTFVTALYVKIDDDADVRRFGAARRNVRG